MSALAMFGKTYVERVNNACKALQAGKGLVLIDDENRENEGDLIFAAEKISMEQVNQMIVDCSGIVCLCLTKEKADALSLRPMVPSNTSPYQTAFTTSIDAKENISTGVSAHDRWMTIHTSIKANATSNELTQPGHIFPLIASENGVLSRRGHTEGSVDLMKIAGLNPAAVLCELMNKDGTMKKFSQLVEYAEQHHLPMLTIEDIHQYRSVMQENVVEAFQAV